MQGFIEEMPELAMVRSQLMIVEVNKNWNCNLSNADESRIKQQKNKNAFYDQGVLRRKFKNNFLAAFDSSILTLLKCCRGSTA